LDEFAAAYPFSIKARKLLETIGEEELSSQRLRSAAERLLDVLHGRKASRERLARDAVVDYVLARIILAAVDRPSAARKYASALARAALERIREEGAEQDFFVLAKDFLPSLEVQGGEYVVSLFDYLKAGKNLLYAPLEKGRLFLSRQEAEALLEKAIEARVSDLSSISLKTLPPIVFEVAREVEPRIPREEARPAAHAGKYLELPCTKKILEGLGEGKRFYGAMALAIACVKDGLSKEDAVKLVCSYAENCAKGSSPFTAREAQASVEWVYRHSSIGFSCTKMREQGLPCDHAACPLALERRHAK